MKNRRSRSSLQANERTIAPDLIDDVDIITRFHISKDTLDEWYKKGLPKYPIGKKTYYKESELIEMIENKRMVYQQQTDINKTIKKRTNYDKKNY